MFPTLFRAGDFEITTFGLMMFLAFAVAGWLLTRQMRRFGYDDDLSSSMIVAAALGGILGAKIYYAILYGDLSLLLERAGLVWYGGLIGGTLAVSWVVVRRKVPYLLAADAVAAPLSMGYVLGRIGCFLVGDDYGRPTDAWFGIAFPKGAPPTTAESLRSFGVNIDPSLPGSTLLKVHPTQLYEAGAALMIFLILNRVVNRPHHRGVAAGLFLVLASIERFLVEIVRAKDDRFLGPFTMAQLISVILLIIGVILIARSRSRPVDTPAT